MLFPQARTNQLSDIKKTIPFKSTAFLPFSLRILLLIHVLKPPGAITYRSGISHLDMGLARWLNPRRSLESGALGGSFACAAYRTYTPQIAEIVGP